MSKKALLNNIRLKCIFFLIVALLSGYHSKASAFTYGGIVYYINEDYAYAINYDGKTPDVILEKKVTYNGREYPVYIRFADMLKNQDNIKSVDASKFQHCTLSLSGCRNLKTVKFPDTQEYYERRQFYDCPSLDLKTVLTQNIQYVGEECFALSKPTDVGTFDNLDIHVCDYNNQALKNRIYTTVIITETPGESLTESSTLQTLSQSGIKNLYATGFRVNDYSNGGLTALETVVVTDGSLSIGENSPNLKSVTAKGKIKEFRVGGSSSSYLENVEIDLSSASEIEDFSIHCINSISELDLGGKVRGLYIHNMPSLSVLNGLEGVLCASITNCKALTKIELPDIEEFSGGAFADNKALKEVYFGDKLREIGLDEVFDGCTSLQDLIYGGTIEQWLEIKKTFDESDPGHTMLAKVPNFWYGHGNAMLTKITELNRSHVGSADKIGIAAFYGFKGLTKIDLPASVKTICASAFDACSNLSKINIRVERIEQHAFIRCKNIETYTLGNQLSYIGPAFSSNNYSTVNFLGTPEEWMKITRSSVGYIIPWDPNSDKGTSLIGSPRILYRDLLFNGIALQDLTIEDVDATGDSFANVRSLKTVTIKCNDKFPEVSWMAFENCTGLEKVSVEFSGPAAKGFDHSKGFVIGQYAFNYCKSLKEIEVLDYIKTIGKDALNNTLWLNNQPANELVYLDTELGLTAYTYNGTPEPGSILTIKDGCQAINPEAFGRYHSDLDPTLKILYTIDEIPASVEFIGYEAFDGLHFSGNFILPATVEKIESNPFWGEIDTLTFAESSTILKSATDSQATLYVGNVKAVNYNRNFDRTISVQGLGECKKVSFGPNITEITSGMEVSRMVTEVYSYNLNPPVCAYTTEWWAPGEKIYPAFRYVNFDDCILYVPSESVEAYRNADGWNMFTKIQAVNSGVQNVLVDTVDPSNEKHFDLYGRRIKQDTRGIHIVIDANGNSSKRIVK